METILMAYWQQFDAFIGTVVNHPQWRYIPVMALFAMLGTIVLLLIRSRRMTREVNQRKKAESRLRVIFDAMDQLPCAMVIINREGTIGYVNRKWITTTGYSADEVTGTPLRSWLSIPHSETDEETLWQTIFTGRMWAGEVVCKTKQGREHLEHQSISPVINDDKTIAHFVMVAQGIPEPPADDCQPLPESSVSPAVENELMVTATGEIRSSGSIPVAQNETQNAIHKDDELSQSPEPASLEDISADGAMGSSPDSAVDIQETEDNAEAATQAPTLFDSAADDAGRNTAKTGKIPLPEDLLNLKALVIDDNRTSSQIFASMLRNLTSEVDQAASGEEGLDLVIDSISERPYDLIVLDWKMPGMDGIETADKIRALSNLTRQPKIILATGYVHDVAIAEAFQDTDLDGFLTKPVSNADLLNAVLAAFDKPPIPGLAEAEKAASAKTPPIAKVYLEPDMSVNLTCPACKAAFQKDLSQVANVGHGTRMTCKCNCGKSFDVILERRKYFRKPTLLRGAYHHQRFQYRGGIQVKNISKSGAGIELNFPRDIYVGDFITLKFDLDDEDKTFITKEGVIRKKENNYVGIEFLTESPDDDPITNYATDIGENS